MRRIGALVLLFFAVTVLPVGATATEDLYREQSEAVDGQALFEALPDETQELLARLGITEVTEPIEWEHTAVTVWEAVGDLLKTVFARPLRYGGILLSVLLIYAGADSARELTAPSEISSVFGVICTAAVGTTVMMPLSDCLTSVADTVTSVSVFSAAFAPAYAGALIAGGQAATAVSFQTVVLFSVQVLAAAVKAAVVPLLSAALAFGLIGAVSTSGTALERLGTACGKFGSWLLAAAMTVFVGVLTVWSTTAAAGDGLGHRALKFSVSSLVPVIGGALGESFSAIRGCLSLLRCTLGQFGVIATALLILPPLMSCAVWNCLLGIGRMVAELFGLPPLAGLLENGSAVMRCLIGVLAADGAFLIVGVTIVSMAAGVAG